MNMRQGILLGVGIGIGLLIVAVIAAAVLGIGRTAVSVATHIQAQSAQDQAAAEKLKTDEKDAVSTIEAAFLIYTADHDGKWPDSISHDELTPYLAYHDDTTLRELAHTEYKRPPYPTTDKTPQNYFFARIGVTGGYYDISLGSRSPFVPQP